MLYLHIVSVHCVVSGGTVGSCVKISDALHTASAQAHIRELQNGGEIYITMRYVVL